MARYLLVDSSWTVASAHSVFGEPFPDDLLVVATTSAGMLACEQARISYVTIDSFSSRQEIIDLGWKTYADLEKFCDRWDQKVQELAPSIRKRHIKPFRFGYYDLKILTDAISVKALLLKGFFENAEPSEIFFVPEQDFGIGSPTTLWPREDQNICSILLEAYFGNATRLNKLPSPRRVSANWFSKRRSQVYRMAKWGRNFFLNARQKRILPRNGTFPIFDSGHDIEYILPLLSQRGYTSVRIAPNVAVAKEGDNEEFTNLWLALSEDPSFRKSFSYDRFAYFDLVECALKHYIASVLPVALAAYEDTRKSLLNHRPTFALTGTINLGLIQRCRMLAAQAHGMPLVTYTEGAGYGSIISPIYDHTEVCDGDVMLCYGEGNLEYYRDRGLPTKLIIPVGSAHQESIRSRVGQKHAVGSIERIMYVGTAVSDNVFHQPNSGLISTCYFSTQLRILRLLASLPTSVQVIVKPNPSDLLSRELLGLTEFQHLRLENRPFQNVLGDAELFIIDYPSTVLLSAISTNAYIFVLLEEGVAGLTQKQQERLGKRAYIYERFEDLAEAVREIVSNLDLFPPRLNSDYMLAYSIHQQTSGAGDRAVNALVELPKRQPCWNS